MDWQRYAIYYTLPPGALAAFTAGWLGWDSAAGREVAADPPAGLPLPQAQIVTEPQRYGFHATLKPPFRLAVGQDGEELAEAVGALAARLAPVALDGLAPGAIGRFLALVPEGDTSGLQHLAAACVEALDGFRAPASAAELARRRESGLTPRQDELLERWGYPYVFEEFRFHMTLTGPLGDDDRPAVRAALAPRLEPLLPRPFEIDAISLLGSDDAGRFHVIHRYTLTG